MILSFIMLCSDLLRVAGLLLLWIIPSFCFQTYIHCRSWMIFLLLVVCCFLTLVWSEISHHQICQILSFFMRRNLNYFVDPLSFHVVSHIGDFYQLFKVQQTSDAWQRMFLLTPVVQYRNSFIANYVFTYKVFAVVYWCIIRHKKQLWCSRWDMLIWGVNVMKLLLFWRVDTCHYQTVGQWRIPKCFCTLTHRETYRENNGCRCFDSDHFPPMCADIRILRSFLVSFSFTLRLRLCSDQQWYCVKK